MQPRLLAISGIETGSLHELVDGQLSIGRDGENQLRVKDSRVSRRHCRIEEIDDSYQIIDLGSRNGTFLNGVPVTKRPILHGDTIRTGDAEYLFLTYEGEVAGNDGASFLKASLRMGDSSSTAFLTTEYVGEPIAPKANTLGIEVGRMARDLGALYKVSSAINSIRDSDQLQLELLRLIFEVVPARAGAVVLMDLDDDTMMVSTFDRELGAGHPLPVDRELIRRVIWERSAITIKPPGTEARHLLCAPLVGVEKIIGVLYLSESIEKTPFREDHLHFLNSVGHIAAVTLENILALDALRTENLALKQELSSAGKMIGESARMARLEDFIARVAPSDSNVLIRGESGTGKEVVANRIHLSSGRRTRPFVAINCAAIPEALLESELFGHEKGAFTGAVAVRKGKLESVEDGTLFLDEIGELAMPMQAKLLRVLQQREFERIGANRPIPLKARVLTATNKDLEEAIKAGEFRKDLYYRLNVVSTTVPPLREHRSDIPLLALYFASRYAKRGKRAFKGISREARDVLMAYDWPGNVRELENAIEHAVVLGMTDEILPEDLPIGIFEQHTRASNGGARFHAAVEEKKKELILAALHEANGNFPEAARLLGLHPKYLHRLARSLDLKPELR